MTKKSTVILGLAIMTVIIGVIAFWPKEERQKIITDTKIAIPTQETDSYQSETGAKEISLSQEQYDEVYLIKELRNKVPISRDYFTIDFDYKINKFIVKYKEINKGVVEFQKWLEDTGYKIISQKYFQIQ